MTMKDAEAQHQAQLRDMQGQLEELAAAAAAKDGSIRVRQRVALPPLQLHISLNSLSATKSFCFHDFTQFKFILSQDLTAQLTAIEEDRVLLQKKLNEALSCMPPTSGS